MRLTKQRRWVFAGLLLALGVMATRGCGGCAGTRRAPDAALGEQLEDLCGFAERGIEHPTEGVRSIGAYLIAHAGDMLKNFGDTIALIERIDDDRTHDDRARVARDRVVRPIVACEDTWEQFALAVADDEEALALVVRAGDRLSRTLAIILPSGAPRSLRELPAQLTRAIDRALLAK